MALWACEGPEIGRPSSDPEDSALSREEIDARDARYLFNTLENEIVPLFYKRNVDDVPRGWVRLAKESIKSVAPKFSGARMVQDYTRDLYLPALSKL